MVGKTANNGEKRKVAYSRQLYLPNNTFQNTFKRTIGHFAQSLSDDDRRTIGDIKIKYLTNKCLGRMLFKP